MHHPDIAFPILLAMSEERICGPRSVQGLRSAKLTGRWSWRAMELSGNTLIALGSWLKARGAQPTEFTLAGSTNT